MYNPDSLTSKATLQPTKAPALTALSRFLSLLYYISENQAPLLSLKNTKVWSISGTRLRDRIGSGAAQSVDLCLHKGPVGSRMNGTTSGPAS